MPTEILEFSGVRHLEQAVDVLLQVRESDPNYPPAADAAAERDSMAAWLLKDQVLGRWVALSEGRVVGHIQVTEPHHYIPKSVAGHRNLAEVGKFFVSPSHRNSGIGELLFEQARAFIRRKGKILILAVLPVSVDALGFYSSRGMRQCGSFVGAHGENLIFVDTGDTLPLLSATGDTPTYNGVD